MYYNTLQRPIVGDEIFVRASATLTFIGEFTARQSCIVPVHLSEASRVLNKLAAR